MRILLALVVVGALCTAAVGCGARARPAGDAGEVGADADEVADGGADAGADAASEECGDLREALVVAFEAAVLCNPAMSSLQCTDEHLIRNTCGCLWAANNRTPDAAAAALTAWAAYEDAGCVPTTCNPCPEPTPGFGCVPLPIGTEGTCEIMD